MNGGERDLYNVETYTDQQLYDILDMNHPTDRELEAKIIHLIQKYENIQNESGYKMAGFFHDIYKRFFSDEEQEYHDTYDDEPTNLLEGFENNVIQSPNPNSNPASQNIISVQSFDYSQDKLQINPLIKQTIKRVISIDSQYRDVTTSPFTTEFTFDLSEPLRDVVSLKLYSVQIPYTWYTISKSYGSNFFYLNLNHPSITNNTYNYQISVPVGTYTPSQLVSAVNNSFQDLSNNYASDVNFNGLELIYYDNNSSKTTVNLNIQNTFNETYYSLNFPYWTPPDISSSRINSIPGYLGFNHTTYNSNTIGSNQTYMNTSILNSINEQNQNYIIDGSNNYFTIIQYVGTSVNDSESTILNTINVTLLDSTNIPFIGVATRSNIVSAVNNALQNNTFFDTGSQITQYDISNNSSEEPIENAGNSIFQLTIILNRYKIKYIPNAKIACIFPSETLRANQYNNNETFTVWKYNPTSQFCCFYFDNVVNEFSQFISETPSVNTLYSVDSFAKITLQCNTQKYAGLNDITMNIPSDTYTLPQLINSITGIFNTYNTSTNTNIFNIQNSKAFLDNSNYFNMQIDITNPFTTSNMNSNMFNTSIFNSSEPYNWGSNFPISQDLSDNSTITGIITNSQTGYFVNTDYIFTISPKPNGKNQGETPIDINLPYYNGQKISSSNLAYFKNIDTLCSAIQTAITSVELSVSEINDTQFPLSKSTIVYAISNDNTYYDVSINIHYYYYLTEANYTAYFEDASSNNHLWNTLFIDSSYNLYNQKKVPLSNPVSYYPYAKITGNSVITSYPINLLDGNNTIILQTTNSNIPTDTITLTIPAGTYSLTTLYNAINLAFTTEPKSSGSKIESYVTNGITYTKISLNINNVFTSADYNVVFYDPLRFTTCFSGSKSVQNTTWDTTIGWILGFRDYMQYNLIQSNQVQNTTFKNIYYYLRSLNGSYVYTPVYSSGGQLINVNIQLTGDTTLSTELFNYFLISLDDYIQNHLNDGLVTITRSQTAIQTTGAGYITKQTCDPATKMPVSTTTTQINSNNATNLSLYSINQSQLSQQSMSKQYSPGPYIKDLFGIIPVKVPNSPGDTYTEFGGSLQNQERLYFGPVNIRKMSIQLLNDRGDIVDLNGSNWTFSFICEQLYRSSAAT